MTMAKHSRGTFLPWLLVLIAGLMALVNANEIDTVTLPTTVEAATTVHATPTIPSPASYTSLNDFKDTVLQFSNAYRSAHDADPLKWNETLVEYARNWAEACIWKHSDGPYGENLAFGYPNASAAVVGWGAEGKLYNYQKPTGFTEKTGHFTQLVWQSTTDVGCAAINCGYTQSDKVRREMEDVDDVEDQLVSRAADGSIRAQGWYVVCEYSPAGNIVGRHDLYFKLNVLPSNSSKTSSTTGTASRPGGGATLAKGVDFSLRVMLLALGTVAIGMGLYT